MRHPLVIGLVVPAALVACSNLMMRDFDKATAISTLQVGSLSDVTGSTELPTGEAELQFAVRGYDCSRPINATIQVTLKGAKPLLEEYELPLDDLTWPRTS
jgi:hypothetical protein